MKICCEKLEDVTIVKLTGCIDVLANSQFSASLDLQSRQDDLIIDLSGIAFMDSAGLGGLVLLIRNIKQCGGRCILASPPPLVLKILKVTAIHQMTRIEPSVEKALLSLKGN